MEDRFVYRISYVALCVMCVYAFYMSYLVMTDGGYFVGAVLTALSILSTILTVKLITMVESKEEQ